MIHYIPKYRNCLYLSW